MRNRICPRLLLKPDPSNLSNGLVPATKTMHGIIAWFARNGVAANLLMISILGAGVWSITNKIILQEYPEFPSREIRVSVSYRGSTPGEIEQAILTRLEEALYDIEGIKEM